MINSKIRDYVISNLRVALEAGSPLRIEPGCGWATIRIDVPGANPLFLHASKDGLSVWLSRWTAAVLDVDASSEVDFYLIALLDEFSVRKYAGTGAAKDLRAYVRRAIHKFAAQ
jgi:hypothetical protein